MESITIFTAKLSLEQLTEEFNQLLTSFFFVPFSEKNSSDIHKFRIKEIKDLNCFFPRDFYTELLYRIENGLLKDKDSNVMNITDFQNYLPEYARGFKQGYKNLNNELEINSSLFNNKDYDIANQVKIMFECGIEYEGIDYHFKVDDDFQTLEYTILDKLYSLGYSIGKMFKVCDIIVTNQSHFPEYFQNDNKIEDQNDLPEIMLKTQTEQIRLLYDLGVIHFLRGKYDKALTNNNQTAKLIAQILKLNSTSVQPTVNALINDDAISKHYPKKTPLTKAIIDKLEASKLD